MKKKRKNEISYKINADNNDNAKPFNKRIK